MNIENRLYQLISDVIKEKYEIDPDTFSVVVEIPKDTKNGDFSTNVAMRLTKLLKRKPQDIAQEIVEELSKADFIDKV